MAPLLKASFNKNERFYKKTQYGNRRIRFGTIDCGDNVVAVNTTIIPDH